MSKLVKLMVIFLGLNLVFSGCAKRETTEEKIVTIRYLNFENLPELVKLMRDIIDAFEKENPDMRVKLEWGGSHEKILTEMAGGAPPDVFFLGYDPTPYVKKGVLLPLNKYVEKYSLDLSQYYKPTIDFYTFDGQLYGLPLQYKTMALVYNKDIFDRTGLGYPDESWTWDDYLRVAKSLTKDFDGDGRTDQFGTQDVSTSYNTSSLWIRLNGGKIFDLEKGKSLLMEDERTKEALKFWISLREACPSPSAFDSMGGDAFSMGKVGMFLSWGYQCRSLILIKNFQWDVAPLPKSPDRVRRQLYEMGGLCIASPTKYSDEAFRFIKFYSGEKGAKIFAKAKNGLTAQKEASKIFLAGPPPGMKYFGEGVEEAIVIEERGAGATSEISTIFFQELDLLILGKKSFEQTLEDASRRMEDWYRSSMERKR